MNEAEKTTAGCTVSLFGCCVTILVLAATFALAVKLFKVIAY